MLREKRKYAKETIPPVLEESGPNSRLNPFAAPFQPRPAAPEPTRAASPTPSVVAPSVQNADAETTILWTAEGIEDNSPSPPRTLRHRPPGNTRRSVVTAPLSSAPKGTFLPHSQMLQMTRAPLKSEGRRRRTRRRPPRRRSPPWPCRRSRSRSRSPRSRPRKRPRRCPRQPRSASRPSCTIT